MALVTHQVQGSYATFPSRVVSQNKGLEFIRFATTLNKVVKTDSLLACRRKSCLSVGAPLITATNTKFLRIAAFEGSAKNDEPGGRSSGSKSAKLSFVQQGSENMSTESPNMEDVPLPYSSEVEQMSGSLAIQNLLKNWLTLLCTSPPPPPPPPPPQSPQRSEAIDEASEGSDQGRIPVVPNLEPKEEGNILTTLWGCLWTLDATLKAPLLLFIPLFLAVNVAYGVQVTKELTPLWIFGPLIISAYVKIFRGICALYVFAFKQTVKVVKNSPASYTYIADGRLKEDISIHLWQPLLNIKNKNYKKFSARKTKELQVWAVEKYRDIVEFIWPTYCRTIRFLKMANFI